MNRRQTSSHAWLAVAYTAGAVMPLFLFGANAVQIQSDLDFGTTELGFAVSSFFAGGAIAAPRTGILIDRLGTPQALRIGMGFSLVATVVVAAIASSWWMAAVGLALSGISHVFVQLALNRMIVEKGTSQALGFGIKQASVPLASLFAGLATAALVPEGAWQVAFAMAGLGAVGLGLLVPRSVEATGGRMSDPRVRPGEGLRRLAVAAAVAAAAGNSLSLLIVDSFDASGFSDTTGALVLGVGSGLAAATRLLGGWTVDRRGSNGFTELRLVLVAGAIGMAVIALSGSSLTLLSIGALLAFAAGWGWQGIVFYSATRDTRIAPATASGIVLSGTMSGSVVGPIAIAATADGLGYSLAWGAAAIALLASAAAMKPPGNSAVRLR